MRLVRAAFGRREEPPRPDLVRPVLGTALAGGQVEVTGSEREDRAAVRRHRLGVVRGTERDALGRTGTPRVLDELATHARDVDAAVRLAVLAGAERLGHSAALAFVESLTRDPHAALCAAAASLRPRLTPSREQAA